MKKLKNPTILKSLDVSTIHITQEDMQKMEEVTTWGCIPYEQGVTIHVPTDWHTYRSSAEKAGIPPNVIDLMTVASLHGCQYLVLDGDGTIYAELEEHPW